MVIGELADIEPVLAYLVGAGIGHINLRIDGGADAIAALTDRFRDANADAELTAREVDRGKCGLLFGFARDEAGAKRMGSIAAHYADASIVYARLDSTPMIPIIPAPPPCLACAGLDFDRPFAGRCDNPDLIAMIAALEAIKILAGIRSTEARLIKFEGYAVSTSPIRQRPDRACACTSAAP
jgi:hypothetical protein